MALYGYSMGGYGALLAAERAALPADGSGSGATNTFRAVAVSSPAIWQNYHQVVPGAFDNARQFARYDVFAGVTGLRTLPTRSTAATSTLFTPPLGPFPP